MLPSANPTRQAAGKINSRCEKYFGNNIHFYYDAGRFGWRTLNAREMGAGEADCLCGKAGKLVKNMV